jgi:hypothetical protein
MGEAGMIGAMLGFFVLSGLLGVNGHCLLAATASFISGVCFIGALLEWN